MSWRKWWPLHLIRLPVVVGLVGCAAADPSKPTDRTLSCQQITEEIASQDASGNVSEARAKELRPGYYAVQAVGFVPYVGDVLGMVDMVTDLSNSRELDRLNENTEATQRRRAYLAKLHVAQCGGGAGGVPPVGALPAEGLPTEGPPNGTTPAR